MPSISSVYLSLYNAVATSVWSAILILGLFDFIAAGAPFVAEDVKTSNYYISHVYSGDFPHAVLVYVQLVNSAFDILHSAIGLVKSPLLTVLLQTLARSIITIGICYKLPEAPANWNLPAFTAITVAWSLAEIIRYGFYAVKLACDEVPSWMFWLRYNMFILLYPVGLVAESTVVISALKYTMGSSYFFFLLFALSMYLPGFFTLYGHMFSQRRKVYGLGIKQKTE
ncbi:hypothetical protein G9P44_002976 [Scheffersomyces stipitis]|nr:hypothetical protein G9P44_002976 [Scheffersomyces stipitis]